MVAVGQAFQTTKEAVKGAVALIKDGTSQVKSSLDRVSATAPGYIVNPFPNPLEQFASFTCVWTLAALTPAELNNPAIYRRSGELKNIVMSSAGRFDESRVNTAYGKPEFYINNFVMKSVIAPTTKTGNSNAVKFEWDIYEPYSMGLLLQSLQVAARNAGYLNYLDNAVYVLRAQFKGFDEDGRRLESIKDKYFVLKLTGVKFQVNESGSSYKMEAVPYNHIGFSDQINTSYSDVKLAADSKNGTVEELLVTGTRSLCAALNQVEATLVNEKRIQYPDVYDIQFPETAEEFTSYAEYKPLAVTATMDPRSVDSPSGTKVISGTKLETPKNLTVNAIGRSDFGFSQANGGNFLFKRPGDIIDEKTGVVKRDNMVIDPKNRSFQFAQGQTITAMINQIILSSQYAKDNVKPKSDGFIYWWKIDVQVELLQFDDWTGDFAKKYTYRVVPFKIHHTVFSNPNAAPIGYEEIAKKIVKKYSYIYTGQNVDVLKFDININNLFFTGTNPSSENNSALVADRNQDGTAEKLNSVPVQGEGAASTSKAANFGRARNLRDPNAMRPLVKGGPGTADTEQKIAEAFHRAFVEGTSADLVKVSLEILGDPYWMIDSGMGNYFASAPTKDSQITNDGTMNYESGDVFVYLTFQTPADVNETTGLYNFALVGKESPFSGIYRVVLCENVFSDGVFKQRLDCVRMPGQVTEFRELPAETKKMSTDATSSPATVTEGQEKPKISVIDSALPRSSNTGTTMKA